MLCTLRNNRGFHHIFIVVLLLAVVGAWSISQWFREGTVNRNLSLMLEDFSAAANKTDPADQQKVNQRIGEIKDIVQKYKPEKKQ